MTTTPSSKLVDKYPSEYAYVCQNHPDLDEYTKLDYLKQIIEIIKETKTKRKPSLKKMSLGWSHPVFKQYILDEIEYDGYMENPLGSEMHDSVVTCSKCKSGKTFNIEKQTRSLDEPTTIITICYDCKHRQKYSG